MKSWIIRWLTKAMREERHSISGAVPQLGEVHGGSVPKTAHCRFGVLEVMNGRVLEVCSFKPNPHGPDWTTTYWILNEEQSLAEQLAVVMTMKGLENK